MVVIHFKQLSMLPVYPRLLITIFADYVDNITYLKTKYLVSKLLISGDYNISSSLLFDNCENVLYNKMILAGCIQVNCDCCLDLCFCSVNIWCKKAKPILEEDGH